jgi:2-methylcitrate dehydratase PrpD
MNTVTIAQQVAKVCVNLKFEDIDKRTVENCKMFFLDCLGTTLSAKMTGSALAVSQTAMEMGGNPDSTIIGYGVKTSPMMAALVNGTTAHSQDFDDDHRVGVLHSSVTVLPAVLAMGEKLGLSGKDVLTAFIFGSEITIRVGEAFLGKCVFAGFHPTGVCGVFGAAAGVGKVLGLSEEELTMALGIAGSQASGITEFNRDGVWTKRLHPGHAAMCGVLSACMAQKGYTGPATVFEGECGFLQGYSFKGEYDTKPIIDELGKRWEVADNSIKLHSCCRFSCNFADCGIDLHNQGVDPHDIESIHAECNQHTLNVLCHPEDVKRHPKNTVNAQFSLPWAIAVGIVKGKVVIESFLEDALNDPLLNDLCEKTTYSLNQEFEAVYPEFYPARVTVKTKNGKTYVGEIQYPKGDPENPATKEEIIQKFRYTSGYSIGTDKTNKVIELVDKLEDLDNIGELVKHLY